MRPRALGLLALAATLGGCKGNGGRAADDERDPEPPIVANGTAHEQTALTVTLNGLPAPMASAFLWLGPDGLLHLLVSSAPLTCTEATAADRMPGVDEVQFRSSMAVGDPRVQGTGAPGTHTLVTVHATETLEAGVTLVAAGTADAIGCPPPPLSPICTGDIDPPPSLDLATGRASHPRGINHMARLQSQRDTPGTSREYETIYILRPNTPNEGVAEVNARIRGIIEGMGGKILKVDNWGKRRLAYEVAKERKGIYLYWQYLATPGVVEETERNLRMLDSVVRYISVKVDENIDVGARPTELDDASYDKAAQTAADEEDIFLSRGGDDAGHGDDDDDDDYSDYSGKDAAGNETAKADKGEKADKGDKADKASDDTTGAAGAASEDKE